MAVERSGKRRKSTFFACFPGLLRVSGGKPSNTGSVPVGMRSRRRNVEGIGPWDAVCFCVIPKVAPKSAGSGPGLCEGLYRGENALKSTPAGREHAKMAEYRKGVKKCARPRFPLTKGQFRAYFLRHCEIQLSLRTEVVSSRWETISCLFSSPL